MNNVLLCACFFVFVSLGRPTRCRSGTGQNNTNDQTIQSQRFAKNQHQNHTDKQFRLLRVRSDPGIADNTNRHTRSQTGQATR